MMILAKNIVTTSYTTGKPTTTAITWLSLSCNKKFYAQDNSNMTMMRKKDKNHENDDHEENESDIMSSSSHAL
jgi:phenylacetate-coenzyme A ligase PaaK-like adenylate-forming protein